MSEHVYWVLELAIKPGKMDAFKALMEEMVTATQANEPGALNYEWLVSEDGATCHIYERYADSAAVMTHMGTFAEKFAERFLDALEPTRFVIYGQPTAQVREALSGFGAVFMTPIGGFAR